jgi:hypothetical protein
MGRGLAREGYWPGFRLGQERGWAGHFSDNNRITEEEWKRLFEAMLVEILFSVAVCPYMMPTPARTTVLGVIRYAAPNLGPNAYPYTFAKSQLQ